VADALTVPFAVAAIVLCVAGAAKLRDPWPAVRAVASVLVGRASGVAGGSGWLAGGRAAAALLRVLAAGEIAVGVWCVLAPGRAAALVLTGAYACFCGLSLVLARRRVACGCFGGHDAPASLAQPLLSAALAAVAVAAAVRTPQGLAWVLGRPVANAGVLALAIGAAVYATVLVHTELPALWTAWSGRQV
jgi:hypothetical protein